MKATGLLWIGPLYDRGGYGNVARNFILGLYALGYPVRTFNHGPMHAEIPADLFALMKKLETADIGDFPVVCIHALPDCVELFSIKGAAMVANCTIFETDRVPSVWPEFLNLYDEIWVPSQFNVETFSSSGVEKRLLVKVPYGMDTHFFSPEHRKAGSKRFPGFTFLYCFAFGWRKGFDLLLQAYREEFTAADDVTLVLKVYASTEEQKTKMRALMTDEFTRGFKGNPAMLPRLEILDHAVSQEELRDLYSACDVYISTDRANGWGMPCMECMSMGIPSATIDWSGSTEFMLDDNSILIPPESELEPVDQRLQDSDPRLYEGHKWRKVKVKSVRSAMRRAFEMDPAELDELGMRGCAHIQTEFSLTAAAEKLVKHIESLDFPDSKRSGFRLRTRNRVERKLRKIFGAKPL
ncbi:MAG: glycosyltransferase family 4 protein [Planctomycetes bacterium]|nr:glycosyltransferase family 4 protein [Planctomycetota bacterium]